MPLGSGNRDGRVTCVVEEHAVGLGVCCGERTSAPRVFDLEEGRGGFFGWGLE